MEETVKKRKALTSQQNEVNENSQGKNFSWEYISRSFLESLWNYPFLKSYCE
jgi:hypothetical protein